MLKICDSVITEPLSIIFKNCIDCGVFPGTWKMSHIMQAHKKNEKRSLHNYRPVSLLPICGKNFEVSKTLFLTQETRIIHFSRILIHFKDINKKNLQQQ